MIKYGVRNATQSAIAPVESCQSWRNQLNFADGSRKNFHQMLDDQGINWKDIEATCESGTEIQLKSPIEISGRYGVEEVTSIVYNGLKPVNTIEFEDGTVMNFTDNHRLLVDRNGIEEWVYVFELEEGDNIVQY
jgi:intein/homing endonuclease